MDSAGIEEREVEAGQAGGIREVRNGDWESRGFLGLVPLKGQKQSMVAKVGWAQLAAASWEPRVSLPHCSSLTPGFALLFLGSKYCTRAWVVTPTPSLEPCSTF